MVFLLQLLQGFRFELTTTAPWQIEPGLDGFAEPSPLNYYQLFNRNRISLFAAEDRANPLIYATTQLH